MDILKKILKVVLCIILTPIILMIGLFVILKLWFFVFPKGHAVAENPDKIGYSIDVDLPDYHVTKSYNNLDRGSSCWDDYHYEIMFDERDDAADLDKELIEKVASDKQWNLRHDTIQFEHLSTEWEAPGEGGIFEDEMCTRFIHVLKSNKAEVEYWLKE